MILKMASLERIIYQGKIKSVTLPGIEGELTILPKHTSLVTPLKKGRVKIREEDGKEIFFEIKEGILLAKPKEAIVLI